MQNSKLFGVALLTLFASMAHAATVTRLAINPTGTSNPDFLTPFNGKLYFSATDHGSTAGNELWASDGVTFSRVADINPGTGDSNPRSATVFNGKLYFIADDGVYPSSLWVFDGVTVQQIRTEGTSIVGVAGTKLILSGAGLISYDGAAFSTIAATVGGAAGNLSAELNGKLFFAASDTTVGVELGVTDGVTVSIVDINPDASSNPTDFYAFDGKVYFAAKESGVYHPWASDGATTAIVSSAVSFPTNVRPGFAAAGGKLFFTGNDSTHGTEPWVFDGVNTRMISDIRPGTAHSNQYGHKFVSYGDSAFFGAIPESGRRQVWKTDGDTATLHLDLDPIAASAPPEVFAVFNSKLYIAGGVIGDAYVPENLYVSDGANPPVRASDNGAPFVWEFMVANGKLFMLSTDPVWGNSGRAGLHVFCEACSARESAGGGGGHLAVWTLLTLLLLTLLGRRRFQRP